MLEIILAIAGIVLTAAGYAVPELTNITGDKAKSKLTRLGKQLYSEIQSKNLDLERLYNAYVNKQSSIINDMFQGAGFGPRMESLRKELKLATKAYEDQKQEKTKDLTYKQNAYNQVTNELNNVGTSISANRQAKRVADAIDQSVNGGLEERNTDAKQIIMKGHFGLK